MLGKDGRVVVRFPANRRRVDRIISKYVRMGQKQISEVEAKDILEAYGFRVLPSALATDMQEAVDAADRIGYPVVMKVVSPDIIHKSDFGGVRINLANSEQVRDAYDLMITDQTMPRMTGVKTRPKCSINSAGEFA